MINFIRNYLEHIPFRSNRNGALDSFRSRVSNPKTSSHFLGNALPLRVAVLAAISVLLWGVSGLTAQPSTDPNGAEGVSTPEPTPNPVKDAVSVPRSDEGIDPELGSIQDTNNQGIDPALRTDKDGNWVDGASAGKANASESASRNDMPMPAITVIPTILIDSLFPRDEVNPETGIRPITENLGSSIVMLGLNRETGQSLRFRVNQNQRVNFGNLTVQLHACYRAAAQDADESWAHVEIIDNGRGPMAQLAVLPKRNRARQRAQNGARTLKNGWIIASSPTVTPIDHPVYDMALIACEGGATSRAYVVQNTTRQSASKPKAASVINGPPANLAIMPTQAAPSPTSQGKTAPVTTDSRN
jgi:hypothetical protein